MNLKKESCEQDSFLIPYLVYRKNMKISVDIFKKRVYTTKQIGNI